MTQDNTPATAAQLDHLRTVALERLNYIRWIAQKLLITEDQLIRREAATILLQLCEGK
jgi:hypothetical protein